MAESKEIRFPNWFCSPSHYLSFLFFFILWLFPCQCLYVSLS